MNSRALPRADETVVRCSGLRAPQGWEERWYPTKLEMGDVDGYLMLKSESGKAFDEMGDLDICIKQMSLIGRRVTLAHTLQNVRAHECQGAEDYKKTKVVALVTKLREMGK